MNANPDNLAKLLDRLEQLQHRQKEFQQEIDKIRRDIKSLVNEEAENTVQGKASYDLEPEMEKPVAQKFDLPPSEPEKAKPESAWRSNLEKFIGENLINKLGILVTVLGVGIGAKYAIDHQLISPLTRIILGYLVGAGLLGFAIKLKKEYHNFSAVLLSGSMAIFYFITFAAHSFFDLIPQLPDFIILVFITVVTVGAAIHYNRQIIAHFGLVGAYAIPFLLDNGTGKIGMLFLYMLLINTGILVVSIQRYWKPLLYSAFGITWLVVFQWYFSGYNSNLHFTIGLTYVSLFFLLFYLILIGYKLLKDEKFELEDVLLLLANATVFYGLGYSILNLYPGGEDFLGLFTLANAAVHALFWGLVFMRKPADKSLMFFVGGMAIVCVTIAVPVQLEGHWVTFMWAGEALLLFFLGRSRQISVYEWLSLPLIFLMFFSLLHDWGSLYKLEILTQSEIHIYPIFNIAFLTSMIVSACFGALTWISNNKDYHSSLSGRDTLVKFMNVAIPAFFIITLYFSFYLEIVSWFNQAFMETRIITDQNNLSSNFICNDDLRKYKTLTTLIYSLLFLASLSFLNLRFVKSRLLASPNIVLNVIILAVTLTFGLISIGDLRGSFLTQTMHEYYYRGIFHIGIRYIVILCSGIMLYAIYSYVKTEMLSLDFKMEYDFLFHIVILTITANELINWMDLFHSHQAYKLALSILFGIYALIMIVSGILKRKKHVRIGAMVLFGATLVKLIFYDLDSLDTISKTIVFISLGILLLIISFLYNKFTRKIFGEPPANQSQE